MNNPFDNLSITISFQRKGIMNSTTVDAPAFASEVVRAAFYGLLQMEFTHDSILDEFERIIQEHRGFELIEFDDDDEEPV